MATWPVEALPIGPLQVATVAWQSRGRLALTVVAKATFQLVPFGVAALAPADAIVARDEHIDGSPVQSVVQASDLALHRPGADVTLLGHAFAPGGRPVPSASVRFGVFQDRTPLVDKTLHVFGDRPEAGAAPRPFTQMPLVYERARRGLENPVGTTGFANVVDPRSPDSPAGFGPISRYWRPRRDLLGGSMCSPYDAALPDVGPDFPWAYFHAAPADQRTAYLRGDEWIVLDGLHPSSARIASRLPGARVAARIDDGSGTTTKHLVADSLAVDADRLIANVVWRGRIDLRAGAVFEDVSANVGIELPGAPIAWPSVAVGARRASNSSVRRITRAREDDRAARDEDGFERTVMLDVRQQATLAERPAMPFAPRLGLAR